MKNLFGKSWLTMIYVFLYIPIITLVVYSFNASPLVTVWSAFTLKWYPAVVHDSELVSGLVLSLKVALLSGVISIVFGTFTAFALVRYRKFTGRTFLASMANAPLVMPDVIVGLSLLLMLVSVQRWTGFPDRGMFTILLGHALVGTAYATVVIMSRLREIDTRLEEAAMDLGCKPSQVFALVTLPLIAPALVSALLLTFTLSFDDVVLSAFLSGPGSTTLPLVIFSRARLGLSPSINAVAAIIIAVVSVVVIASSIYQARAERRRQREVAEAYAQVN
jgi:putrescine transport system permease protein